MTDAERKAQREKWEDDNYSKLIDCPAHPGEHWAILYEWGHRHGGFYECPRDGEVEEHEHVDYQIEETEDWPTGPMDNPTPYKIYVCGDCGVAIPLDEASPDQDAHDAMVDAQIDEMRGK